MSTTPLSNLTLPALILRHGADHPQKIAICQKQGNTWQETTWADYARRIRACAAGMQSHASDGPIHTAVLADNSTDWLVAQMATSVLGGVPLGCYPTSSTPDLLHALGHADVQILFCQNDAHLAKVEPIRGQLPQLQLIVMFDPGSKAIGTGGIVALADLERAGQAQLDRDAALLDHSIAALNLDQVGLIVYTSGSTGAPKAAMLTYRNMRTAAQGFGEMLGYGADATVLSYLPLCHIAEQAMTNFATVYTLTTIAIGGSLPTLSDDLVDIRPTYFSGVPRVWLRLQKQIRETFAKDGQSDALDAAIETGSALAYKPRSEWTQAEQGAFQQHEAVRKRALEIIGMDRTGIASSGAASLAVEVLTFFRALGLELLELFGQTESCSVMTIHRRGRVAPGTVGEKLGTIDLRIADDGEILVKGDNVFKGYYKNPEATRTTIVDGWLHTGDIGVIENGQLRIVDRKKDIMITDGGKNISPAEIEALMRSSDLVEECVLVADSRKYVSALLQIDPSCAELNGGRESYERVVADPAIQSIVSAEIRRLNEDLPRVAQVKRAYILPAVLKHEQGELTPTLKMRRFMIHKRYEAEIEAIYSGKLGLDIYPRGA